MCHSPAGLPFGITIAPFALRPLTLFFDDVCFGFTVRADVDPAAASGTQEGVETASADFAACLAVRDRVCGRWTPGSSTGSSTSLDAESYGDVEGQDRSRGTSVTSIEVDAVRLAITFFGASGCAMTSVSAGALCALAGSPMVVWASSVARASVYAVTDMSYEESDEELGVGEAILAGV